MGMSILVTFVCVITCIVVHLYVLRLLWHGAWPRLKKRAGMGLAIMVLGCIVGHMFEIAVCAVGIFVIAVRDDDRKLAMAGLDNQHLELWYYSANFYTSLGAEKPPTAGLRVFMACEALTGLILITWTASFLFLLMESSWGREGRPKL